MSDPFKDTRDPLVRSMERGSHQREVDEQKEIVVRMRKLNSKVIAERDAFQAAMQRSMDEEEAAWTAFDKAVGYLRAVLEQRNLNVFRKVGNEADIKKPKPALQSERGKEHGTRKPRNS